MIVNLDSESGAACENKARGPGIKSIDYDRLTLGGGATLLRVVRQRRRSASSMGEGLVEVHEADGKTTGEHRLHQRRPDRQQRHAVQAGLREALKAKIDSGGYKLVGDQTVRTGTTPRSATIFEQIYTQNQGKFVGVVAANDGLGGGGIAVLTKNKLAGKVPVTGQDATDEGLQRVIARHPVRHRLQGRSSLEAQRRGGAGHRACSRATARPTRWPPARSPTPISNETVTVRASRARLGHAENIKAPFDAGLHHGREGLHHRD